jgi:hypothetical protein
MKSFVSEGDRHVYLPSFSLLLKKVIVPVSFELTVRDLEVTCSAITSLICDINRNVQFVLHGVAQKSVN